MRFKIQSRHSSPKRTLMKDLFYSGTYQKFELIKQCFDGLFVFSISISLYFCGLDTGYFICFVLHNQVAGIKGQK